MRQPVDQKKINEVRSAIGRAATTHGRVYLTGGATALAYGWRETTLDIDLSFDPEPGGVFLAIADLKNRLSVNIELTSPSDFVPALPGWEARSVFVERVGSVEFFHFDPYSQALSKLARGFERDLADVRAMVAAGLVAPVKLVELYAAITEEQFLRYPAMDREGLNAAVARLEAECDDD